jgi:ABC-type Mn2+/Zn2+ transport system ATPase subunit
VKGYSLGMRQRLALGTALLARPPVLVLDEPTNGLDPEGVHWLRGFLRRHAEDGGSVLVSSHQLAPTSSRPERPPALGGPGKAVGRVAQGFKHALPAGVATLVHDDEIAARPAVVELPGHIDR